VVYPAVRLESIGCGVLKSKKNRLTSGDSSVTIVIEGKGVLMARKRKKPRFDLNRLDPKSPEYWDEVLRREGLTPDAGRSNRVIYVENIDRVSDKVQGKNL
jgi:hypothetical protein